MIQKMYYQPVIRVSYAGIANHVNKGNTTEPRASQVYLKFIVGYFDRVYSERMASCVEY